MNNVSLIGRLTADPELKQAKGDMTVLRFNMAIDRGKDKNGESRGADFPSCVAFGRTAEVIAKYFKKGHLIGIVGRIQTGSYDGKDGKKVYTTDVIVDRIDFCDSGKGERTQQSAPVPSYGAGYTTQSGAQPAFNGAPYADGVISDGDLPF